MKILKCLIVLFLSIIVLCALIIYVNELSSIISLYSLYIIVLIYALNAYDQYYERMIIGKERLIHCWLASFLTDYSRHGSNIERASYLFECKIRFDAIKNIELDLHDCIEMRNLARFDINDRLETYKTSSNNFWNILDFIYQRKFLNEMFDKKLKEWSNGIMTIEKIIALDNAVRDHYRLPKPTLTHVDYPDFQELTSPE